MLGSAYWDAVATGSSPTGMSGAWANAIDAIAPGAAQDAAQSVTPGTPDYIAELFKFGQLYVTTDAQRRLLNIQLDRARNNLPPLDSSQYGLGVNVGLSPSTLKTAAFVALGIGALFLLMPKRR